MIPLAKHSSWVDVAVFNDAEVPFADGPAASGNHLSRD
jgi:hypothetical protein